MRKLNAALTIGSFLVQGVAFLFSGCAAYAASPDYTSGVTAYGAKNFREAIRLFGNVVRAEPRNITAVYYLANSYYSLGQQTAALNYFKWLAQNYPQTNEGRSAQTILDRLGAQSMARNDAISREVDARMAAVSGGGHERGDADIDEMIVTVKNLADHPALSKDCISTVKSSLQSVPPNVVAFLQAKGCHIYITPTMIDKEPGLLNSQPRGYEQGKTYKNVPACFDGRDVIVCNYALRGSDDWEPTADPGGSVKHELGHAIDHYMGWITSKDDFKLVYYKDCGKAEPELKERLQYFVQKAEGGPSECFAECVCTIFGGRSFDKQKTTDVKACFPNVIRYIEKKMEELK